MRTITIYRRILFQVYSESLEKLPASLINTLSPSNPLKRLANIIKHFCFLIIKSMTIRKQKLVDPNKIWLFVVSRNNFLATKFLGESFLSTTFVKEDLKEDLLTQEKVTHHSIRYSLKFLYSIKYPFILLYLMVVNFRLTYRYFDLIFYSIGYYELSSIFIRKNKPSAIVFSNDHNVESRALLFAAKKLEVPTIYIQHASVASHFPPIAFDLSLLEGQDSLNKYQKAGELSGEVALIGMPRFDHYVEKRNLKTTIDTIGICWNLVDNPDKVESLANKIHKEFPELKIILRPHPGDQKDYSKMSELYDVSDSKVENAMDFLLNKELIIAGNSNILLEATLLNCTTIYYPMDEKNFVDDYYGFVKNGLTIKLGTEHEVVNYIGEIKEKRPGSLERACYYNESIGTSIDGKSCDYAIKRINQYLSEH